MSSKPKILPPKGFKPSGVVEGVRHSTIPPSFIRKGKKKGKRAEGLRYEAKVQQHLGDLFGSMYVPNPWFVFRENGRERARWCQPDGLLFMPLTGQITIVEVKLQHTSDAWWQTKWLYLPVLAKAFPGTHWKFAHCEVVKWFDTAVCFPEKVRMRASVSDVTPFDYGVHIWKP